MWKRGDDMPTKLVTLSTRLSFCSRRASESATTPLSSMVEPAARCISTAKLLRSAFGSTCTLMSVNSTPPSTTEAAPMASVSFLWRKQRSRSHL